MFMGEYNHTVDAKGRLIVPSKFREQLGDEFVITKGLDNCLFVYDNSEWTALEEKLRALPITNTAGRKFSRFLLGSAATCEVDKQGRILLPSVLREFAGIGKDAVLVGVGSRIEIWNKDNGCRQTPLMIWKKLQNIWKAWVFDGGTWICT